MSNKIIIVENNQNREIEQLPNCKVEWLGKNSQLKIHTPFSFVNTIIQLGDNCMVEIKQSSIIKNLFLRCASSNSKVNIGERFIIESGQFILARGMTNQSITIGDNCLFSSDIFIQTADGHTIFNKEGDIINCNGGDVRIGNHVWLGHSVSVLKKGSIADNTIVAEKSTVTKAFIRPNCILAGIPAKIIKTDINWNIRTPEENAKSKEAIQ